MDGASIALVSREGHRTPFPSNRTAATLDDAEFTLGEGPSIDALREGRAVWDHDLASTTRWPAFAASATALGAGAVAAFPLRVGAALLGVLSVYRSASRPFGDSTVADTTVVADIVTGLALSRQAGLPRFDEMFGPVRDLRAVVHHASGMTAAQLGCGVDEALARIRAFAFANNRTSEEVATEIASRRLRLDDDHGGGGAPASEAS